MADLIAFQTYHLRHSFLSPSNMIPRSSNHKRSLSSGHRSPSPDRTVTKTKSTNDLLSVTTQKPTLASRSNSAGDFPDGGFSTLKDPRLANDSETPESCITPSHHPDLSSEVAALSVKLIQAINNQTTLDDSLVATRQELEQAQNRLKSLESENERYRQDIEQQILIKKVDADLEISGLQAALAEEKTQRAVVEKGKKTIEQELETLTAALFEEANKMVAAAKLEREAVEKKNEQLRAQVKDTELLLASHQEQLAELKSVMQGMNLAKDDVDTHAINSTAPSSPTGPQKGPGNTTKDFESTDTFEPSPHLEEVVPGPSTSFPHLIKSVCRTDIQAFEDFRELFILSKASKPPSRAASGSYAGLNVMSLANFGGAGFGSASSSPAKSTHSPHGSMSSPQPSTSHIPLKETRFYKRVLMEDIEPTLRLDAAPGISWLTRRTVLSSICEGSLVVEPMPAAAKKFDFPCSLCGDRRPGTDNERTHRFRTSDNETAQRYPLCVLCLERVRSSCEFTGYLRLILDGHIRGGDIEEEKDAWEETIRLRERMFWSRIGGGVIPAIPHANELEYSGPASMEHINQSTPFNDEESHYPSPFEARDFHDYEVSDSDYDNNSVSGYTSKSGAGPMFYDSTESHASEQAKDDFSRENVSQVTISAANGDSNPVTHVEDTHMHETTLNGSEQERKP
ncbi:guanine nucleotide exchange factor SEC2 [Aspergillus clavatus NRRL 1]|uniref:GDP/GTP exchange factor Sec2p, putative n=1 Tax=Aspergillus clavatus (strain ATCC 1007 / CBS 513.65 / DSM 816 / NCTC 3887 / NRRL 1 / QM 1276 / 107) TaxID=344612 RepID=A1CJB1_ASPCL|nr:GDP/GTP exchange factor Sec2p, putative [Aspergillus clavatus NRRL 1]EAW09235.1 GDP/GTP exchange factor Sec2p, putative [Aspergillus clavatus NRRL 1]